MLHFTQWMTASRRKRAQHFFFHLKGLIQTEIHKLVDSKQTCYCTNRHRDRQDSNRLAEKNPRTEHRKEDQEEQYPRPLFLPYGERAPADPVDHAAGGE